MNVLRVIKTRGTERRPAGALRTVERSAIVDMDWFNQLYINISLRDDLLLMMVTWGRIYIYQARASRD